LDWYLCLDDWIGIYACDTDFYHHATIWQWACGSARCQAERNGTIVFDSLPDYNQYGPHAWPVIPTIDEFTGDINRCFKAVYLRNDGVNNIVPPYENLCQSNEFNILENETTCPLL